MTGRGATLEAAEGALGVRFKNRGLLAMALTHSSFAAEAGLDEVYERLEFLGDAVLGFIVAEHLYRRFPDSAEGDLSKLRRDLVNGKTLAGVAEGLGLSKYVFVGNSADFRGPKLPASIMADVMEAVIGAIYLDRGIVAVRRFITGVFGPRFEAGALDNLGADYKTQLQELTMPSHGQLPHYVIVRDEGPPHAKIFFAEVWVAGELWGRGSGPSKREAEQQAACEAWSAHGAAKP